MDAEQGRPGLAAEPGRPDGRPDAADAVEAADPAVEGPTDVDPSAATPPFGVPLHPYPTTFPTSHPAAYGSPGPPVPGPPVPVPPVPVPPPDSDARPLSWTSPPPPRTHRWGLGAYLLVEFVFLAVSALVGLFVVGGRTADAGALAVALAVPTLIAAGLAILITKVRGNGPKADLRLNWSWRDVRLGLLFGLGGLFVTLPASMIYVRIVGEDATSAVGEVFGQVRASPVLAVVIFLTVVFIAPLCEEIVYRGLLWGAVERLGAGRWVALVVTTLLFALAHFEFTRTPLLLVVAIPIALARLYTGGLVAGIVAHQVNNLLPGIALLLGLLGAIPMV